VPATAGEGSRGAATTAETTTPRVRYRDPRRNWPRKRRFAERLSARLRLPARVLRSSVLRARGAGADIRAPEASKHKQWRTGRAISCGPSLSPAA
jgi:hypothetical protein